MKRPSSMLSAALSRASAAALAVLAVIGTTATAVSAGPARFEIININAPGIGFNDPTPVAPVGGNTGTTLGQQRLIAFTYAASIWSARLDSNVPIVISE